MKNSTMIRRVVADTVLRETDRLFDILCTGDMREWAHTPEDKLAAILGAMLFDGNREVPNPAIAFTKAAKNGEFNNMSDEEYAKVLDSVRRDSEPWDDKPAHTVASLARRLVMECDPAAMPFDCRPAPEEPCAPEECCGGDVPFGDFTGEGEEDCGDEPPVHTITSAWDPNPPEPPDDGSIFVEGTGTPL